jgi:hypothetical protein
MYAGHCDAAAAQMILLHRNMRRQFLRRHGHYGFERHDSFSSLIPPS